MPDHDADAGPKKRKQDVQAKTNGAADPKLEEYLQVMGRAQESVLEASTNHGGDVEPETSHVPVPEAESDDEYEMIPSNKNKQLGESHQEKGGNAASTTIPSASSQGREGKAEDDAMDLQTTSHEDQEMSPNDQTPAVATNDEDWLRSRTNRLLDLMDPDDLPKEQVGAPIKTPSSNPKTADPPKEGRSNVETEGVATAQPTTEMATKIDSLDMIHRTSRLFVRNLPYGATEDDIRECFQKFGDLEEVRIVVYSCCDTCSSAQRIFFFFWLRDEFQIGTTYTPVYDANLAKNFSRCFDYLISCLLIMLTTRLDHGILHILIRYQVHLPASKAGSKKGFALLLFADPSNAVEAFQAMDGATFQGRLLHIIPADAKRELGLDEFALSKLPLKKQNIIRKKAEASSNTFNWNSLYMNQDAVNTSVAARLGVSKSELLDPTSSDAAVKQAIAETSVIQETKAYFIGNGVDLEAFKSHKRGDRAILVKNFPYGTTLEELRTLFEEAGPVLRVLMPPSGTIAIVEFSQPNQAQAAFGKLAYRRVKDSILFLEKAPKDLFRGETPSQVAPQSDRPTGAQKPNVGDLLSGGDNAEEAVDTTSLFVRNLNFETTTAKLAEACSPIDGFVSSRVKTKTDPKKPGQTLSMGFGFVEFRSKAQAQEALKTLDGYVLDGYTLSVKASHRGVDAAEERRRDDRARKAANKRTKIIIKNLPFQATKKDIRALFGTYGQLRSVRVPKKADYTTRGFAFADFVTSREAENALNALRDTHLLGRKLVLDYAEAEALDAEEEIEKMQRKVGGQVNKMALQQLAGRGRQKVNIGNTEEDLEG